MADLQPGKLILKDSLELLEPSGWAPMPEGVLWFISAKGLISESDTPARSLGGPKHSVL